MASCNLNDRVKFRLTPKGEKILNDYLAAQRAKHGCDAASCYRKDACGYRTCILWEFMNVFGPSMHIGLGSILDGNNLIFCGCD
jgi:hypothetical protein